MPGKGEVELTGQMGDVMKESAMIGMSYVRSIGEKYGIPRNCLKKMIFISIFPKGSAQGWPVSRRNYGYRFIFGDNGQGSQERSCYDGR